MKKVIFSSIFVFFSLIFASNISAQCEGYVYFWSESGQFTNSVHGFTTTELDYCAGLYYDPAIKGNFIEGYGTGVAIAGEGYSQGYANQLPASLEFNYFAPINNGTYTTNGNHYVIAYYLVYVAYWNDYGWFDPWNFGFLESGGGNDGYYAPDYFGYWTYVTYWITSPQYVASTADTITYTGQTRCAPGQQFNQGQPCPTTTECPPGQQFTSNGVCVPIPPTPEPPTQPNVRVIVNNNNPMRPRGVTGSTNAQVITCIQGIPNVSGQQVTLQLVNDSVTSGFDGGHKESASLHTGTRPKGILNKSNGVTGADGCFRTTYAPPHISGKFKLTSTISGISNETDVWVYFPGLYRLLPNNYYNLIGSTNAHPSNHWGTSEAVDGLLLIANDYAAEFYGNIPPESEKIAYNDISLEWGGKFDLFKKWEDTEDQHGEHREGINCDTRSNNIDKSRWIRLNQIFRNRGSTRTNDETATKAPHWHLRFEFDFANVTTTASQMQNGVEQNFQNFVEYNDVSRTPASITSQVSYAIFDREVTQSEFEVWHPQLTNAKAQGSSVFLQEVKTFERQLFASQEYVARQRNDEQFIQDVFASHLFRKPTQQEIYYWLDYLANIGGIQENDEPDRTRTTIPLTQTQRRQRFLNYFQTLPDFVNLVNGIVDNAYPEPTN